MVMAEKLTRLTHKKATQLHLVAEGSTICSFRSRRPVRNFWIHPRKHHSMETLGDGGIAPRILDLGTRRRRVASFTIRPLYPQGKGSRYQLDRRLDGPQSRSGHGGEEKDSHSPPRIEPPNPYRQACSQSLY